MLVDSASTNACLYLLFYWQCQGGRSSVLSTALEHGLADEMVLVVDPVLLG
jgi:hypothetical protein